MSVKHDWYQSDSKVVITILLKNATEKNYQVQIEKERIKMTADNYELELELYHPCIPERSSHKASSVKVEISLAKETAERWEALEKKKGVESVKSTDGSVKCVHMQKENWDKFVQEFEKEQQEEAKNEEALNNLFQKIYGDSNEEVRRAMNKSYMESGGTVLSTNWNEVGKQQVDVKPPDGTEYKKWNS